MSTHICMIEKELYGENEKKWGYTVKTRFGHDARDFNTPTSGENSEELIAHDLTHHCFAYVNDPITGLHGPNHDECCAIGLQVWGQSDFASTQGTTFPDILSYQLYAMLKAVNWEWDKVQSPYQTLDKQCRKWLSDVEEDIMMALIQREYEDKYGKFAMLAFIAEAPVDLPDLPSDETLNKFFNEIAKLLTHGCHHGRKIYGTPENAHAIFEAISNAVKPYVINVDEYSPDKLKLSLYIHDKKAIVEPIYHK